MVSSRDVMVFFVCASLAACERPPTPAPAPNNNAGGGAVNAPGARTGSAASAEAACAALGGRCVGVGDCGPSVGHLADPVCGAPHLACCITPADSCGGREDFSCCAGTASFRPTCRNGRLECREGATHSGPAGCEAH